MSEITDLFLNEKPVMALVKIRQAENETFCSEISEEIDSTYSHTVKIIAEFREMNLVETREEGRKKMLKLTDKGKEQADTFIDILNLSQETQTNETGQKLQERDAFSK